MTSGPMLVTGKGYSEQSSNERIKYIQQHSSRLYVSEIHHESKLHIYCKIQKHSFILVRSMQFCLSMRHPLHQVKRAPCTHACKLRYSENVSESDTFVFRISGGHAGHHGDG